VSVDVQREPLSVDIQREPVSVDVQREPLSVDVQREPVSVDVQRKGNGFNIFNLVTCNIENGCCVHLRLLTAVENNFAGDVMDCNGTVALIF